MLRESGWSELTQAQQEQAMGAYNAYTEALKNAGVLTGVQTAWLRSTEIANGHVRPQILDRPLSNPVVQLCVYFAALPERFHAGLLVRLNRTFTWNLLPPKTATVRAFRLLGDLYRHALRGGEWLVLA